MLPGDRISPLDRVTQAMDRCLKWLSPPLLMTFSTPCPIRLGGESWSNWRSDQPPSATLAAPFDMKLPSFVAAPIGARTEPTGEVEEARACTTYEIAPERFKVVEDWLTTRRQLWEARLDRLDQYVKQLKDRESKS